ncbi:hypothetical protein HYFRA_00004282 [Hymenoscyphus fraxineus]|uniref:Uncharacterized protein n=1 Tax=Hymenoscyphus fraxineus TaxID=746836 RepID=A0A9N9KN05_9HELO|nr:hypothetical protein HYFRA_00004282 [Hymenoscyphus fraxineus]
MTGQSARSRKRNSRPTTTTKPRLQNPSSKPPPMFQARVPHWEREGFTSSERFCVNGINIEEEREKASQEQKQREKFERAQRRRDARERTRKLATGEEFIADIQAWRVNSLRFLSDRSGEEGFPRLPTLKDYGREECPSTKCIRGAKLDVCHHDVDMIFRRMDFPLEMPYDGFLKKERLRWHPDRFSTRLKFQDEAKEFFQLLQKLIDDK